MFDESVSMVVHCIKIKPYIVHYTQVVMLRCGQPLTAIGSKRSREDEKLVNGTLGGDLKGIIIDTRSQTAAMNSRSKGTSKTKNCRHAFHLWRECEIVQVVGSNSSHPSLC